MARIPQPKDLFGHPWEPPRDPRGRKAYKRSEQVAKKIAVSRAGGMTVTQIAKLSGLTEPTLRKYYLRELQDGADLVEAALNEAVFDGAMAGKAGAQRLLRDMITKGQAAVPIAATRATAASKAKAAGVRKARLGKKEQLVEDAKAGAQQGSEWAKLLN